MGPAEELLMGRGRGEREGTGARTTEERSDRPQQFNPSEGRGLKRAERMGGESGERQRRAREQTGLERANKQRRRPVQLQQPANSKQQAASRRGRRGQEIDWADRLDGPHKDEEEMEELGQHEALGERIFRTRALARRKCSTVRCRDKRQKTRTAELALIRAHTGYRAETHPTTAIRRLLASKKKEEKKKSEIRNQKSIQQLIEPAIELPKRQTNQPATALKSPRRAARPIHTEHSSRSDREALNGCLCRVELGVHLRRLSCRLQRQW